MTERSDIAVVGAGPAGAIAALVAARAGHRTLLIEKHAMPRPKVCGGCLSASGVDALRSLGLGGVLDRVALAEMCEIDVRTPHGSAVVPVKPGLVVDRNTFDHALTSEAVDAGARLIDHTTLSAASQTSDAVALTLRRGAQERTIYANVLIDAAGLASKINPGGPPETVRRRSRIGAQAIVEDATDSFPLGRTAMHVVRGGYVGVARFDHRRINIAMAVDPRHTRELGISGFARRALVACGTHIPPNLDDARWSGTPALSRRRPAADGRIFYAGDSAGYVEPFTGEGMSWAIVTGRLAAQHAIAPLTDPARPTDRAYARAHRSAVATRWRACAVVRACSRSPLLSYAAAQLCARSSHAARLASGTPVHGHPSGAAT